MTPLTLLLAALAVAGQRPIAGPQTPSPVLPVAAPVQAPPVEARYILGPQDQLRITVYDEADLTAVYRVDADGMISFPLVGRLPAGGLTLAEFQNRLTTMLAAGYIRNPQVRVEIDQFKSQSVYVIGEVRTPGKISMTTGTMTVIEALAIAGSPTSAASNEVIVVHPRRPNSTGSLPPADAEKDGDTTHINRKDLELGRAGHEIVLHDGDIINVPLAQRFYITGQVKNAGYYVLDPGMTIQQAIALAGGLTDRGSDRGITASRMKNGKLSDVSLKLEDKVQASDTIMIRPRFF